MITILVWLKIKMSKSEKCQLAVVTIAIDYFLIQMII